MPEEIRTLTSIHDANLSGQDTYELTVPQSIVKGDGYFSITVYDGDSKLLIPNDLGVCDRTTYSAEPESDGTYRIIISPDGKGHNSIPTGRLFYAILRAYVTVPAADMTVGITRH